MDSFLLLTKEKFEEILLQMFIRVQESESIKVIELIEEIKDQIIKR